MKGFGKLLFSIIKKNLALFLSLTAVELCGVALLSGMTTAYSSLIEQVDGYVEECRYPSLTISTDLSLKKDKHLEKIEAMDGVLDACYALEADASASYNGKTLYTRIFTYGGDNFRNYALMEEQESDAKYTISADASFARRYGISLGGEIQIDLLGSSMSFVVDKLITSCDDYSERQSDILPAGTSDFGFLYLEESTIAKIPLLKYSFNRILVLAKQGADLSALKESVQTELSPLVNSIKTYDESPVGINISYNLDPLKSVAIYLPIVFYGFSMIVTVLFVDLMVKSFRREMGVMMCLGYEPKKLSLLFACIGLFSALFASILGLALGYGISVYGYTAYLSHFDLVFRYPSFQPLWTSLGVILCFLTAGVSAALSSFLGLRKLSPIEAASGIAPSEAPHLTGRHLPLRLKLEGNRALRNGKANLFSVLCLGLSFALIYTAFSFSYGRSAVVTDLFETRMDFSALVFFSSKDEAKVTETLSQDANIQQFEVLDYMESDINAGGTSVYAYVGLPENEQMIKIMGTHREILPAPSQGIVLDSHAAASFGVKVGDSLDFLGAQIPVEGISQQDAFRLNYLPKSIFESCASSYSLCATVKCADHSALKKASGSYENCTSVVFMSDMESSMRKSISRSDAAVVIILGMSSLLGIAVVANIKISELFKEKRRIAVERAMGYSLPGVSFSWLAFDLGKTALSSLLGYGIGVGLAIFILGQMDSINFSFPFVNAFATFGYSFLVVLALQLISHLFLHLKLNRMNLAVEAKSRE